MYKCVCCGNNLFTYDTKFDSITTWPSLDYDKLSSVKEEIDRSYSMIRTVY
ncbi:MAG: peptide-methionine (R)-S-oxide reductase [Thermoproteota archaeon]|nr:peptide-methionine (R)-S-oxide reductase [Thermoproteota archaeon]